ncbi:FAD-binding protein [Xylanibacillus composti]|uniref:Fumarate reductase subunit A n=1 Tax=Xylanibacillus composti TaxID=1572762 RepID=A0A8J4H323_9BACL|nr:FAD-binding protein [Xylanibacillus composti]MDT9726471.1 FAD-binding protein [Xylanibacillus composti]GIQ69959.1 fumarate reductase subunit A [Xylanibacillus composti]
MDEQLKVDVAIVGGGLAALRAAIAAAEEGASVAVVVKGMLGRSGSSAMTTGGFAAVVEGLSEGDTPEIHAKDTLKAGAGVGDPELVQLICEKAAEEVAGMQQIGGKFFREPSGELYVEPSGEHAFARVLVPENHIGTDFTLPMAEYVKRLGITVLEQTMCLEVVAPDGQVEGIICSQWKEQRLLQITTPSVILCTGGSGHLFSFTSNPRDVTGDGYMLAYEAGAELRDMEFIQFYPWRCIEPFDKARVSVQPPTFVKGGRLFNSAGERFMERYDPQRIDGTTRDLAARGIYDQIRKGLAVRNGVLLDVSEMSEETFKRYNPKMYKALQAKKLQLYDTQFIIAPEAHYFMGGVRIDTFGRSTVEGLYAAGETAGGIHGANRANSNALPEILVIAARAGRHAAAYAQEQERGSKPLHSKWQAKLQGSAQTEPSTDYKAWMKKMRACMDQSLGIIRNKQDLVTGLLQAAQWREQLLAAGPADPQSVREWFELAALCQVGEMSLTAALARTESRGAHYREDFNERSPEWEGVHIVVKRAAHGTDLSLRHNRKLEPAGKSSKKVVNS